MDTDNVGFKFLTYLFERKGTILSDTTECGTDFNHSVESYTEVNNNLLKSFRISIRNTPNIVVHKPHHQMGGRLTYP